MKLTIVMMLMVLGLVSPTRDISTEVVKKLEGLGEESWNNLTNSLCYVSHMNMPAVHGRKNYGDHPIYPDGFRWAEIKLYTFQYEYKSTRSLRISNRLISNKQNAGNEMKHCTTPNKTKYSKQFYEIRYPIVYFGYFYQIKVVPKTSHEKQKKEEEYRNLLERYRTARIELKFAKLDKRKENYKEAKEKFKATQNELEEIQPELLKGRYQVEKEETPQLRLYFKSYKEDEAEYYKGRTLALYIDNPTTEDLGLAMSVCKVAHKCIEIDENIYQKLKKNNDDEEDKFFKESLENQIEEEKKELIELRQKELLNNPARKGITTSKDDLQNVASNIWTSEDIEHIKEEFLFRRRLSGVFLHDFLSYGGKTGIFDEGIGAFVGLFSDTADSAIRNDYDEMYKKQKYKILDSNHLMLATIVGYKAKKELTDSAIQCNVLAYQEGFYRYLMKVIEDNIALIKPKLNKKAIINLSLRIVQAFEDEFMKYSGFGQRFPSISDRIKEESNGEIDKCEQYFKETRTNQQGTQQQSFLEKRIKLRRHRLARKLTLASIIEVFKAIKEFFVKVTAVAVATTNLVVHVVSTVIFGVIYAVSIVTEFAEIVIQAGMKQTIGETHINNIFFIPSRIIRKVLEPIAIKADEIINATSDQAFNNLIRNQLRQIWVQDESFYKEENVNNPITLDTYTMFSNKPETLSKIFRILLSK